MNFLKQHFSKIRFITYFIWMIIFLFSGIIFSYYGHKLNDNNIILQGIVFSTGIMILGLKNSRIAILRLYRRKNIIRKDYSWGLILFLDYVLM